MEEIQDEEREKEVGDLPWRGQSTDGLRVYSSANKFASVDEGYVGVFWSGTEMEVSLL